MTAGAQQHYFAPSPQGGIVHRFWDPKGGITGDRWAGVGKVGMPVAYTFGGEQHVFARIITKGRTQGQLVHWYWHAGMAKPQAQIWAGRNQVTGDPTGFATATQQHVFYRGSKGTLEHRWWDARSRKRYHDNWKGSLVGAPVAYLFGAEQHVFARTADGSLRHWYWHPGLRGGPRTQLWSPKKTVLWDPAGFATGTEQHVFFQGLNGTLQHYWWNSTSRKVRHDNWGGRLVGAPVAYVFGSEQEVFGRDKNGQLRHWYWHPGMRKPSSQIWAGQKQATWDPAGFATGQQQHVFFRGRNGSVEHFWWDSSTRKRRHDNWGGSILKS
jgi:hypothetical protein